MKRLQTSLLEPISISRSEGVTKNTSISFDERCFLRLKLFFSPYPEYRIMLGETAPDPLRLLTITRRDSALSRQFVVMIERRLFSPAIEEWAIPTLLRLVRACTKQELPLESMKGWDPWVGRLYDFLAQQSSEIPAAAEEVAPDDSQGNSKSRLVYIWRRLVNQYFPEQPDLVTYRVVWSRRRHTSTLASCQAVKRVVRVAAVMGKPEGLPYLEPLLYHELCHAALGPIKEVNGRRVIHGREFKALENLHPGIPALNAWINSGGWRKLVSDERRQRPSRPRLFSSR